MKRFAKIDQNSKLVLETVEIDDEDILNKYLHEHYCDGETDVFWKEFQSDTQIGDTYCQRRDKFLSQMRHNLPEGFAFDEETCTIVPIMDLPE